MKHPTILDVAEQAGVSKSLVSLVMRGSSRVSDASREAVLRAAGDLGYRPNAVARSLVRRRSFILGVMLSDLHNPFFAEVVDGIEEAASEASHQALLNTGQRSAQRERHAIETLLQLRVDGLILAAPAVDIPEIVEASRSVPVVVVGRSTRAGSVDSVTNDDRLGAELVVNHLVQMGHRKIAHIHAGGAAGARPRKTGYEWAMRRGGLGREIVSVAGAFTEEGGATGMRALLARNRHPTAVFAANDLAAIGVLEVLDRAGLRVPEDMSVVGYDNTHIAGIHRLDLTTIDQPRFDMGRMAVALLLERLNPDRTKARHLVMPPKLVVRGSSGPPPNRLKDREGLLH